MYKIIICDNDENYIKKLKKTILTCCTSKRNVQFLEYFDGTELLKNLPSPKEAWAVFLDAKMEDSKGKQVDVLLRNKKYDGTLVLYSENDAPTAEMIKISPYRYLSKMMSDKKLEEEIGEIIAEMDRNIALLSIEASYQREKVFLRTTDIVYFTHHRKGSVIHLTKEGQKRYTEGNVITTLGFKELLEVLYPVGFIIPHNSYLVNLKFVTKYNVQSEIFELDSKIFPISRKNISSFAEELREFKNGELKKQYFQIRHE